MERIIYLDNSSTTKPSKKSCDYINQALTSFWGNPSSLHTLGIDAELQVTASRQAVAKKLSCREDEIVFTGSGTEANNTAVGTAFSKRKTANEIITTKIEHPSVLQAVKRMEDFGFSIKMIDIDSNGKIDLNMLEKALSHQTAMVSIMLVNNEIGSIQPIEQVSAIIKRVAPNALFHCDAVQAFGKIPINVKKLGVDMLSASGHKIHGPKGIGFLYCKKGIKLLPFIVGGGQEKGMRSGTEAVPLIYGLKGAVDDMADLKEQAEYVTELRDYAKSTFADAGFVEINSPEDAIPFILNISVPGYRSETLLHYLESKGIFVSSGSACAKGQASYVLEALGLSPAMMDSALRLSFSKNNTKEDIDLTLSALKEAVVKLRRSVI